MIHTDHVNLIKKAGKFEGIWAELGSGSGAFTLALRDLGGDEIIIYSIDKDKYSLEIQKQEFDHKFPNSNIKFKQADFNTELDLPKLDGILLANSLHYVKNQLNFLVNLKKYLKSQSKIIIVEYNSSEGNIWVPYPLTYQKLKSYLEQVGFSNIFKLGSIPSKFLTEIYAVKAQLS